MRILVGTCGFSKSKRLIYEHLDAVEVQQTFYDPPPPEKLARLREEAPEEFIFTIKAWMLVTHKYNAKLWRRLKREVPGRRENYGFFQDTEEVWRAWNTTLEAARALEAPIIVLQTPASFTPTEENLANLRKFMSKAPRDGRHIVWEPRGSWWDKPGLLAEMSRELGVIIAGDYLRGRIPVYHYDNIAYTRLHGLGGREVNYKYKYTQDDLKRLADIVKGLSGVRTTYVMFNNVYSYQDAVEFKKSSHKWNPK